MAQINFQSLFPGGEKPDAVTTYAAGILLGALLFLVFMRRGFRGVLAK